ncbi:gamma-aminobutyric acid receptor alpha-like [Penaeus monodon]|uniref:gamma-aminobutyric acid receptor alpha-like n=1 Tax=Penaeus monodon TaxID=6687 RepID=UPI0018A73E53|nr:gamma-aminobutyric acid receptor alpha-like [Penaeus monodon]
MARSQLWGLLALLHCVAAAVFVSVLVPRVSGERSRTNTRAYPHNARQLPTFIFRSGGVKQLTPTKNISSLLDNLLKGYDHKLRPSFGGEPTTVEIDIEVRSMSRISEMDMTYSMDCYFRQSWVDERLAFSDLEEAFTLSVSVLEKLWKPDTFIYNGKQSYVHLITTPNKFIRLYQNGRILYSSRLTINANCPMNLRDFPMDTQHCPLKLGSFSYTTRDVVYRWNKDRQVVIAPDLMLSQFDLIAAPSGDENTTRRAGEFSTLLASFYLQRHMGNFLIQVYGPCMLLVVLSWVSFWLNREATSDRISLGITTVLTMTFLGLEARTDLPKVSYITALDLFVWISYGFIFATIIEFAFVHVFTKVGSGEVYLSHSSSEADSEEDPDEELDPEPIACTVMAIGPQEDCEGHASSVCPAHPTAGPNGVRKVSSRSSEGQASPMHIWAPASPAPLNLSLRLRRLCGCVCARGRRSSLAATKGPHHRRQSHLTRAGERASRRPTSSKLDQINSVSNIDEISRVLFPFAFVCINLLYWYTFLSHTEWSQNRF